jgi:hypothetical protein
MTYSEGDGSFQKRLDNNQCPKCLCKLVDAGGYRKCDICNLIIHGEKSDSEIRQEHTSTKEK